MKWQRPNDTDYPRVWHRFCGRKPMPDGIVPTFRVQDVPVEYSEALLNFMSDGFLRNEPVSKALGLAYDESSVRQLKKSWSDMLKQRAALICFREDPSTPNGIFPEIVGANILYIPSRNDEKSEMEGDKLLQLVNSVDYCLNLVNIFEKYGIDHYLAAYGLSVAQGFQGQNIGAEILKARVPLCKGIGIKVTATVFTAIESQMLAKKVGFETIAEISYDDLTNKHGFSLGNVECKDMKLMSLVIN